MEGELKPLLAVMKLALKAGLEEGNPGFEMGLFWDWTIRVLMWRNDVVLPSLKHSPVSGFDGRRCDSRRITFITID